MLGLETADRRYRLLRLSLLARGLLLGRGGSGVVDHFTNSAALGSGNRSDMLRHRGRSVREDRFTAADECGRVLHSLVRSVEQLGVLLVLGVDVEWQRATLRSVLAKRLSQTRDLTLDRRDACLLYTSPSPRDS